MPHTIRIVSIKGGVGKTTIASSIATDLANHYKKKVLLVDANFSAPNAALHMNLLEADKTLHDALANKIKIKSAIKNRYGVDIIPGRYFAKHNYNPLKLKDKLKLVKNDYDYIILDASPSMNEEVLASIIASDSIFIVTTPDYPTLSCSLKTAKFIKNRGKKVAGIILNKIRDPLFEISLKEIEKSIEIPVVARILDEKLNTRALYTRIPMPLYKRNSQFSKEINNLCAAITG